MKILVVGGKWEGYDESVALQSCYQIEGAPSETAARIAHLFAQMNHEVNLFNGGKYVGLCRQLYTAEDYDVVFWMPELHNIPDVGYVKDVAPYVMLITGVWNPHSRLPFVAMNIHTLQHKANLTFELLGNSEQLNGIHVYDPLGCSWYRGEDLQDALMFGMSRLNYLRSITRRKTVPSNAPGLMLSWYFDAFKMPEAPSGERFVIPDKQAFVDVVTEYSDRFMELRGHDMPAGATGRPQVGRCLQGMPSFRHEDKAYLSPRAPSQRYITLDEFIPCYMDGEILRYGGEKKPTVDAPVHLALYAKLPQINYILHAHDYIDGAPFTTQSIPCGAIEEVDEVMKAIELHYGDTNQSVYRLNLKGHGSLLMAATVEGLYNVRYIKRQLPEPMEVMYEL